MGVLLDEPLNTADVRRLESRRETGNGDLDAGENASFPPPSNVTDLTSTKVDYHQPR